MKGLAVGSERSGESGGGGEGGSRAGAEVEAGDDGC